jgi:S-adenosylmethionine synthetase
MPNKIGEAISPRLTMSRASAASGAGPVSRIDKIEILVSTSIAIVIYFSPTKFESRMWLVDNFRRLTS